MPIGKKRILLTGSSGQVGAALSAAISLCGPDFELVQDRVDLADANLLRAFVRKVKPHLIINPAAYTAVDKAESEPEKAFKVNAVAPGILAEEAKTLGISLIHFSTDYVFDGSGSLPRNESAPTGPLGVYGTSKLAGEVAVTQSGADHLILRTSWVFSERGTNFVKTMLRLGAERDVLKIVADQVGAPTSAAFLARATLSALEKSNFGPFGKTGGIYHLCCRGQASWHEFACEIFRQAREQGMNLRVSEVLPIASSDYPTPARRPLNSRLDCSKFATTFGVIQDSWQQALIPVIRDIARPESFSKKTL